MDKLKKRDKFFWIFLLISVSIGFIFPHFFLGLEQYTIFIIPTIIGILFLKVDILDVITHLQKPFLLFYISFIKLLFIPLITYFCFQWVEPELLMGLVLLAALPTGVSSAVFTDIMKGRTSLNLSIVILTNLLSIFTLPIVFLIFHKHLAIPTNLFFYLLGIIFIPFFIAKFLKRGVFVLIHKLTSFDIQAKLSRSYNLYIVILLGLMMTIVISFRADTIMQDLNLHLKSIGILFLAFILFQLVGYFSVFWLHKGEKIAISNSCMIVNNILGIVLAIGHFSGPIVTFIILSLIPWNTMIIAKHWYKRYLP
ncbi:hypothetical protein DID76_01755 [Candidatus Marinamargulisbacteria bacterium SCGC AG-414-C22]|nr:hypothetical protein DID76_01755 [Candidatus Marinamargulisbacteria bacterium SCGC AG-414-C22]